MSLPAHRREPLSAVTEKRLRLITTYHSETMPPAGFPPEEGESLDDLDARLRAFVEAEHLEGVTWRVGEDRLWVTVRRGPQSLAAVVRDVLDQDLFPDPDCPDGPGCAGCLEDAMEGKRRLKEALENLT